MKDAEISKIRTELVKMNEKTTKIEKEMNELKKKTKVLTTKRNTEINRSSTVASKGEELHDIEKATMLMQYLSQTKITEKMTTTRKPLQKSPTLIFCRRRGKE